MKRLSYLFLIIITLLSLSACHSIINYRYSDTLPKQQGVVYSSLLIENVTVRRNNYGIPLIKGNNLNDIYFVLGYIHASDRISYMTLMRLTAQGRLSEYLGESALDVDHFMRTMQFSDAAKQLYQNTSPESKQLFQAYANGVNAWLITHKNKLPMDLDAANYQPELWQPIDSVLLFQIANFGLSGNLHEEIASLILAQQLGSKELHRLFPIYPDEPLPIEEAQKLTVFDTNKSVIDLEGLQQQSQVLQQLHLTNMMASNNWAVTADLTQNKASLLANDPHLPIGLPSLWSIVQIDTPQYKIAGATIAGIPAVIVGATPELAWGYTMVMADNQDLFLEQIQQKQDGLYYLYQDQWLKAKAYQEVFHIRDKGTISETFYETKHGVILNNALKVRKYPLQPIAIQTQYGLALQTVKPDQQDKSVEALAFIYKNNSVKDAIKQAKEIRALSVNMLFADKNNIGWQLTGAYPIRKKGIGLFPSPGWTGKYDWLAIASVDKHPSAFKTTQSYLATANNRVVAKDYPINFSKTWAHPERFERINNLLASTDQHNFHTMKNMQYDQVDLMIKKLHPYLQSVELNKAIQALSIQQQLYANKARQMLIEFDGNLQKESANAALYALFLHELNWQLFHDELGDNPAVWQAITETAKSYSTQIDHLLNQEDSPFWDNIKTPEKETKAQIIALALAESYANGLKLLGNNDKYWQWGQLHTYRWNSLAAQMAPYLPPDQQKTLNRLDSYLNRGPIPAGGNFNTIDISNYTLGENFDTTLIPSLRMIVDFSQANPLWIMNNAGQSANPASSHYADNIDDWLQGNYINLPFTPQAIEKHYDNKTLIFSPGCK